MRKLILISSIIFSFNSWAYNETDLAKFRSLLNACESCDLSAADLSGANLYGADLSGANLRDASLYRVNLRATNLIDANLSGANLSGANLTGANLKYAILDGAKYCKTQMPWGEVNDYCEE